MADKAIPVLDPTVTIDGVTYDFTLQDTVTSIWQCVPCLRAIVKSAGVPEELRCCHFGIPPDPSPYCNDPKAVSCKHCLGPDKEECFATTKAATADKHAHLLELVICALCAEPSAHREADAQEAIAIAREILTGMGLSEEGDRKEDKLNYHSGAYREDQDPDSGIERVLNTQ